ncbi:MAG: sigma-70 family RNA polymerase sigma factor [Proteobacteria bacterium]|nr:sigma-70 family RNA polymerase sigma factor [Pseudomonadota bacterium]
MSAELDEWFVLEILPHEEALMRFLARAWSQRGEIHDLRQEIYARVYQAATAQKPRLPKAFLFATARHLMTDRLRRSRVVSIEAMGDLHDSNVLTDERSPDRWLDARQTLKRLAEALDRLPDRCREVVWLRRVEDLPQKQIAARLGISEKTVEKQIAKGTRLIAQYFYGGASDDDAQPARRSPRLDDHADRQRQPD